MNENIKRDIKILIDIDDVIEKLLPAWVEWLNRKYNFTVDYNAIDDWNISKFFPDLTREQVFEPLHKRIFWWTVKPRKDAMVYIKKLFDEGYDLYLCTATDYRNIKTKYEAIVKRYFPYITWNKVIVTSEKQMIKADFLIDDAPHNLIGGDYIKMLMDAPHNKNFDIHNTDIGRVSNWKEIYRYIHLYTDIKRKEIETNAKKYKRNKRRRV